MVKHAQLVTTLEPTMNTTNTNQYTTVRPRKLKLARAPELQKNKDAHALGQHNPQQKHSQQASGRQPPIEDMRCPAVKCLLVLTVEL